MDTKTNQPERALAGLDFTKITIESDGTPGGTSIKLNGEHIKDLSSLDFYFYRGTYGGVSLSFSTRDEKSEPGSFYQTNNYYLVPPEADSADASKKATAKLASGEMPAALKARIGQDEKEKLLLSM